MPGWGEDGPLALQFSNPTQFVVATSSPSLWRHLGCRQIIEDEEHASTPHVIDGPMGHDEAVAKVAELEQKYAPLAHMGILFTKVPVDVSLARV